MGPRSIAAALGFVLAAPLHADVYRWVDARGSVSYGQKPPAGAQNVRRLSMEAGNVSVIPIVMPRALPLAASEAPAPNVRAVVPPDGARLDRWREHCFAERRVDCDRPTAATFDVISSSSSSVLFPVQR